jgi:hypothetical protein
MPDLAPVRPAPVPVVTFPGGRRDEPTTSWVEGSPVHDGWWLERLLDEPSLAGSQEMALVRRHPATMLVLPSPRHHGRCDDGVDDEWLAGFVAALRRVPGVGTLVKLPSGEDPLTWQAWFRPLGPGRVQVSRRPTLQLAHLADLAVGLDVADVPDALRVGTGALIFRPGTHDEARPGGGDGPATADLEPLALAGPIETIGTVEGLVHVIERLAAGDGPSPREIATSGAWWGVGGRRDTDRAGDTAAAILQVLAHRSDDAIPADSPLTRKDDPAWPLHCSPSTATV